MGQPGSPDERGRCGPRRSIANGTVVAGPSRSERPALRASHRVAPRHSAAAGRKGVGGPAGVVRRERGQTDARVRYYAQGDGYGFFVTPSEVMMSFAKKSIAEKSTAGQTPAGLALALKFVGGDPNVEPQGASAHPVSINDSVGPIRAGGTRTSHSTEMSCIQTCGRTSTCA